MLLNRSFSVLCFVDHCLSFFFWPLCCLSFFDFPFLITPLGVFKRFLGYNYKQSQSICAKQHTTKQSPMSGRVIVVERRVS